MSQLYSFYKNTRLFYFSVFLIFGLIFLGHYFVAGQAVYGDGIEYFAWLHTIYFDHDLNFKNEQQHLYNNKYNNAFPKVISNSPINLTLAGRVGNFHMPGMAILLLPFYIFADLIVLILNLFGFYFLRNGYSDIYQIATGLGAVFYGVLGIIIYENLIKKIFVDFKIKTLILFRTAILTVVLASPLIYYLSIDVLNSHFATFFVTAMYFYVLFIQKFSKIKFILLGILLGLAFWVRIQEIALFSTLILTLSYDLYLKKVTLKETLVSIIVTGIIFIISISPLLLVWQYLYGSFLNHPYFIGFISNTNINLLGSLFDPSNGLFSKTPFLLFILITIPLAFKYLRKEFVIFFIFLIIQIFAITKYGGWPAASFGGRMYISTFSLFFLLASLLFIKINKRLSILIITFFVILNFINIFNFMLFDKQSSGGHRGLESGTKIKIEKILKNF